MSVSQHEPGVQPSQQEVVTQWTQSLPRVSVWGSKEFNNSSFNIWRVGTRTCWINRIFTEHSRASFNSVHSSEPSLCRDSGLYLPPFYSLSDGYSWHFSPWTFSSLVKMSAVVQRHFSVQLPAGNAVESNLPKLNSGISGGWNSLHPQDVMSLNRAEYPRVWSSFSSTLTLFVCFLSELLRREITAKTTETAAF